MSDPEDIISDARSQSPKDPDDVSNFENRCITEYLRFQDRKSKQYLDLQQEWSFCVKCFLWISTILAWTMIFSIGVDWLNFEKYPKFPHAIVGGFFAQILGLGYVVVKYLFPPWKSK